MYALVAQHRLGKILTELWFGRFYAHRVRKGCECPPPPIKVETIVEEKKCHRCSFETWKPQSRKCVAQKLKEDVAPSRPRKCCPGMVVKRPHSGCKPDDICPFKNKPCADMPKEPPRVEAKTVKKLEEIPIPAPTWSREALPTK